ncbi:MAG: hypothetical protein ACLFS9_07645 [Nitriliruptoraceae bacterium]
MRTRLHLDDAPFEDLLATYVRDHLAGAAGGHALAQRAAGTTGELDAEAGRTLRRLADEIGEDRRDLRRCAAALGIRQPRTRELAVRIAERLGRMKLNAQLLGTSALSPVLELDLLIMGVSGKARVWRTLAVLVPDAVPDDIDLDGLERRAIAQREELEALQDRLIPRLHEPGHQ